MKGIILATMATIALTGVAWAQAPHNDQHHPPAATSPAPTPTQRTPPAQSETNQQQGMMGGMRMMNMMAMMR